MRDRKHVSPRADLPVGWISEIFGLTRCSFTRATSVSLHHMAALMWQGALSVLCLQALIGGLLPVLFLLGAGRFLVVDHPPSSADAIVVLGGRPSVRVGHGVALFKAGYASRVVLSGGSLSDVGGASSSTELSREQAIALGLPPAATLLAPGAQSTFEEAENLRALAEQRGWRSLIVVTDQSHSRRAARTFQARLPDVTVSVSAAPDPRYDPVRWWANEHSLTAVFTELLKLGYYWLQHGVPPLALPIPYGGLS